MKKPAEACHVKAIVSNGDQNQKVYRLPSPTDPVSGALKTQTYDLSKVLIFSNGEDCFVKKMIGLFLEEIPKAIATLHNALLINDYNRIIHTAHGLVSSVDLMGLNIVDQLKEIEKIAGDENCNHLRLKKLTLFVSVKCNRAIEDLKKLDKSLPVKYVKE